MNHRTSRPGALGPHTLFFAVLVAGCGPGPDVGGNLPGTGGSLPGSGGGGVSTGGVAPGTGGASSGGSGAVTGGSGGAGTGPAGTGGRVGTGGATGPAGPGGRVGTGGGTTSTGGTAGGVGGGVGSGGAAGSTMGAPLDCGPIGVAIENAGPPRNRVNYVILGDGYTATTVNTTFMEHINVAMAKRFSDPIGQPYLRYRKFVNICALKVVSQNNGVSLGDPAAAGPTAFSCGERSPGQDTRLAQCNTQAAMQAQTANLPAGFEVDWHAIVLNNSKWWNTGAVFMLWSGGNKDAAGAALHEGGHGFHQFDDEYTGSGGTANCTTESGRVNTTVDAVTTAGKWDLWLGYNQMGATGMQGAVLGGRYCSTGTYRPSQNSMMNSLFGNNVNTSFNSVSREKMIMDIWRAVVPIDSTEPPAGVATNPAMLKVNVIDPAVINVDWTVDGAIKVNAGPTFDTSMLVTGMHTITARAYDNAGMDLVRYRNGGTTHGRQNWARSTQTVTWTVTKH